MVDQLWARWKASSQTFGLVRAQRWPAAKVWLAIAAFVASSWSRSGFGSAPCTERLTVDWRFNAAAPILEPPAVSSRGWVVVGSVDGYVHALDSRGLFQWSYTLDAPPFGVTVGADGRTYALSREGVLHVMLPSGQYQWGGRLPAGMLPTGTPAHSEHGVVFVPSELNLYAFSAGSGLMWRTFVGSPITSGPLVSPDGDAWVGTRSGRVMRIRSPKQHAEFTTPNHAEASLVYVENDWVLAQTPRAKNSMALVAYDSRGQERWSRADVARVSGDGQVLRGSGAKSSLWAWIEPATGRVLGERELELDDSAAPARFGKYAVVPTNSGRVYLFGEAGSVEWCQVSTAPLLRAHVRRESGHVIAAAGDGWVAAIRFRAAHDSSRTPTGGRAAE
jgi:outer membrane protein assembly factor BamB